MVRKIRIEYYKIVMAKKDGTGKDIDFPLEKLIAKAESLGVENRIQEYYQEEARLDKTEYNKILNYWYLNFVRLRQTKLPVLATKDTEAIPMKLAQGEYIGEDVTAIYDVDNNVLALQRNRDSLSATGIEEYLTRLNKSAEYGIYLRPVPMSGLNEKVRKAKIFRKITIQFATDAEKTKRGLQASSFARLFEYFSEFNSKTATLTLSMGYTRKGGLDMDTIAQTIADIYDTEGIVTGAEVNVKESETEPVDTIDLFAMKYHDFIMMNIEKRESIDYIELGDKICEKYNASKKAILETIGQE